MQIVFSFVHAASCNLFSDHVPFFLGVGAGGGEGVTHSAKYLPPEIHVNTRKAVLKQGKPRERNNMTISLILSL